MFSRKIPRLLGASLLFAASTLGAALLAGQHNVEASFLSTRDPGLVARAELRDVYSDWQRIKTAYKDGYRRVILLDYDGTVVPFHSDPESATPSATLLSSLRDLAGSKYNTIWFISGRDKIFLDKWFGNIDGLGLSAEHGALVKEPGKNWVSLGASLNMAWKSTLQGIMDRYSGRFSNTRTEVKQYSLSWHYRDNPGANYEELYNELNSAIRSNGFDVSAMKGNMVVEVKHNKLSKGKIVEDIVSRSYRGELHDYEHGGRRAVDFLLLMGDDTSDEQMFKALRGTDDDELEWSNTFSFWVQHENKANKETDAKWRIPGPDGNEWNNPPNLLHHLAEATYSST
ncbi:Trehalose-phosphatase [Colletotrichum trifolii]|uniref:Trehalose 6-phosphate phosphatase n=1 Tax=Colletotrichum trifolii TaxID=5466 RepID=A0A4R8R055_COLTR|nr:Trehalose-phosphatase [Colletotrichum trifolii]